MDTEDDLRGVMLRKKIMDWSTPIQDFMTYCYYNTPEIQELRRKMRQGDKSITETRNERIYRNNILIILGNNLEFFYALYEGREISKEEKKELLK